MTAVWDLAKQTSSLRPRETRGLAHFVSISYQFDVLDTDL